jgi:DNA-directed RNA polymerase beta subunit
MPETIKQISFAKLDQGMEMPHLLDIQTRAFEALLQLDASSHDREDIGLERVFKDLFPITDVHENFSLEFVRYSLGEPKYTVEECIERDMTYSAPLKATLQLVINEVVNEQKRPRNIIEKEVYLGELPLLTPLGTFVINGAERVIVSQLHRSPGVVFEESTHPNGQRLISARIIPFRGSWVEFTVDIHDVVYVHIDKKKKFPATALLRAFGYGTNSDILRLFFAVRDLDLTKKRESRTDVRELFGAIIAEDIALPGEATAEDAPKARTKKAKAERERAENVLLVKEGDELTEEVYNRLRRQNIDSIKVFASHMKIDLRDEQDAVERGERPTRRQLALDVVDSDGEVIAEAGQLLTDAIMKKIRKAEINKVSVFVASGRAESTLIKNTLAKDPTHSEKESLSQIYALLRPGDAPDAQTAKQALERLFFSPKRYDLGRVGRYKINQRLGMNMPADYTVLSKEDFVEIVRYLVELHEGRGHVDDIDHLGNRRIRSVGELIANQFSVGLSRMARLVRERMSINTDPEKISLDDLVEIIKEMIRLSNGLSEADDIDHLGNRRVRAVGELIQMHVRTGFQRLERGIRERMTIQDPETVTPQGLISTTRPVMAAVREFFGGSQLSQFMDQTNPLSELTHKRRLSALGPGGLSRERAGFDVRDVHPSHYGRICPIETPEGPNIGLIGSLATYGRINQYGFIETPYRRVLSELNVERPEAPLVGQILRDDVVHVETGEAIAKAGTEIDDKLAAAIQASGVKYVRIKPVASDAIRYLSADLEDEVMIAQANTPLDEHNRIIPEQVTVRVSGGHRFPVVPVEQVAYMDVSPKQVVSVATSLIPFLEHDDANRALMGANMQKQAVPLLQPASPVIGTGVEYQAARDSGQVLVSRHSGEVTAVSGRQITLRDDEGAEHVYNLQKFIRSNQDTCINQRPSVRLGQRVDEGDKVAAGTVLADGP